MMVLAHAGGDLGIKVVTTATLRRFGFRTVLIASAASFGVLFLGLAFADERTPQWIVIAILLLSGIVRSLQMTSISSMQFADVPREKFSGAATFAALNQNVMRAVGIALAALVLNAASAWRGRDAPSVADFHVALALGALLSLAASVRYLSLPKDAGRHVSAGRGG